MYLEVRADLLKSVI